MYRDFNAQLPEGGVEVDCDHDGVRVGELVYAEVAPDERVHCVCVIDEGERLAELEQPVYYSPTLDLRGCGGGHVYIADEARIIGLSLTFDTARVGATALQMLPGDLRAQHRPVLEVAEQLANQDAAARASRRAAPPPRRRGAPRRTHRRPARDRRAARSDVTRRVRARARRVTRPRRTHRVQRAQRQGSPRLVTEPDGEIERRGRVGRSRADRRTRRSPLRPGRRHARRAAAPLPGRDRLRPCAIADTRRRHGSEPGARSSCATATAAKSTGPSARGSRRPSTTGCHPASTRSCSSPPATSSPPALPATAARVPRSRAAIAPPARRSCSSSRQAIEQMQDEIDELHHRLAERGCAADAAVLLERVPAAVLASRVARCGRLSSRR